MCFLLGNTSMCNGHIALTFRILFLTVFFSANLKETGSLIFGPGSKSEGRYQYKINIYINLLIT